MLIKYCGAFFQFRLEYFVMSESKFTVYVFDFWSAQDLSPATEHNRVTTQHNQHNKVQHNTTHHHPSKRHITRQDNTTQHAQHNTTITINHNTTHQAQHISQTNQPNIPQRSTTQHISSQHITIHFIRTEHNYTIHTIQHNTVDWLLLYLHAVFFCYASVLPWTKNR